MGNVLLAGGLALLVVSVITLGVVLMFWYIVLTLPASRR